MKLNFAALAGFFCQSEAGPNVFLALKAETPGLDKCKHSTKNLLQQLQSKLTFAHWTHFLHIPCCRQEFPHFFPMNLKLQEIIYNKNKPPAARRLNRSCPEPATGMSVQQFYGWRQGQIIPTSQGDVAMKEASLEDEAQDTGTAHLLFLPSWWWEGKDCFCEFFVY